MAENLSKIAIALVVTTATANTPLNASAVHQVNTAKLSKRLRGTTNLRSPRNLLPLLPSVANATDKLEDHLLVPYLEPYVDVDFTVGELKKTSLESSASSVVSAAGVSSGGLEYGDDISFLANAVENEIQVPKIVAAGKGMALYMPPVFRKVIELSGKERPNILYIGTASFDKEENFNKHSKKFLSKGCSIDRINVAERDAVPSYEEMRRLVVEWSDVLVCSGGNTLFALLRWKETGLDLLIKEAAANGTVLCGGSAGAGCWFTSMHSDSLRPDNVKHSQVVKNEMDDEDLTDWDYVKISGLGIIPTPGNIMAVPHFDRTGSNTRSRSEAAGEMVACNSDVPAAIGIDNNAALVVEGDKVMAVSGDGEATVHIVFKDEGTREITTSPMNPTDEYSLQWLLPAQG